MPERGLPVLSGLPSQLLYMSATFHTVMNRPAMMTKSPNISQGLAPTHLYASRLLGNGKRQVYTPQFTSKRFPCVHRASLRRSVSRRNSEIPYNAGARMSMNLITCDNGAKAARHRVCGRPDSTAACRTGRAAASLAGEQLRRRSRPPTYARPTAIARNRRSARSWQYPVIRTTP